MVRLTSKEKFNEDNVLFEDVEIGEQTIIMTVVDNEYNMVIA